ncbi:MAG: amino acid ABC transporter permease [Hyphomicrobiaceae bacterium]|nr:MAG: amino acid ABC transporter permease [Hyphomicrobiaceae bacterium]
MPLLFENAGLFLTGLRFTMELAVATLLCATIVSVLIGLMSAARAWPLRVLALIYVEFWRDIPLLVNLLFIYFGAPLIGVPLQPFSASLLSLTLWGGANGAEIVRGGINSVGRHQIVSGTALGLSRYEIFRFIVLPQALMPILPPMTGLFTSLIQATSLASLVGVNEFFRINQIVVERTTMLAGHSPAFVVFGFALLVYFLICSALTKMSRTLESRLAAKGTRAVKATGLKESA